MLAHARFFRCYSDSFLDHGFVNVMPAYHPGLESTVGSRLGLRARTADSRSSCKGSCKTYLYKKTIALSAWFCVVEEDKFTHPIGIRFFCAGGIMFYLNLITQLVEKLFRR